MSRRCFAIGVLIAGLGGCASVPEVVSPLPQATVSAPDRAFQVAGRFKVNHQGRGYQAAFDWQHAAAADELNVKSPLGTTLARLQRDAQGVRLQADGQLRTADNVETLTREVLGWPLPLSNLAWWARGQAAPGEPAVGEADGRLTQQGWLIRHAADAASGAPRRLELERDGMTILMLFTDWRWQDVPAANP